MRKHFIEDDDDEPYVASSVTVNVAVPEKIITIRLGRTIFHIGDTVILKRHPRAGKSRIVNFHDYCLGGVVLEDKLDGFHSWNVTDLKKVPGRKKTEDTVL
jgi:hypothetical protein